MICEGLNHRPKAPSPITWAATTTRFSLPPLAATYCPISKGGPQGGAEQHGELRMNLGHMVHVARDEGSVGVAGAPCSERVPK